MIKKIILKIEYYLVALIYHIYLPIRKYLFGIESINRFVFSCKYPVIVLKLFGAKIGHNVRIGSFLVLHGRITDYSNLKIGNNVHIGKEVFIDLCAPVIIHDNCTISMRCALLTHTDTGDSQLGICSRSDTCSLEIFDNTYLGINVTILCGARQLGPNLFIGACSLVTKKFGNHMLIAGVPAKYIKSIPNMPSPHEK